MFTDDELLRYSRHLLLPEWDLEGQEKIKNAHIIVVGCGGLGNHALPLLAAAGVGRLTIIDFDKIELSNLQRQTTFTSHDVGKSKVDTLKKHLLAINPTITLHAVNEKIEANTLRKICNDCTTPINAILDCTDHFQIRYEINKVAVEQKIPLISGAAIRFEGQFSLYDLRQKDSPCYACLFDGNHHTDGNCATLGVFSPLLSTIGALQAQEALKLIIGLPVTTQQLRSYNALNSEWTTLKFNKNPHCKICNGNR